MSTRILQFVCFILIFSTFLIFAQDNVPPSTSPPNGLNPQTVPMLVSIGFDDNSCPSGVTWACDYLRDKLNNSKNGNPLTYDNTPVRVTFLNIAQWPNSTYTVASNEGHEIGNHTFSHFEGGYSWDEEIQMCNDTMNKYCPNAEIFGFRTPRLEYQAGTWAAIKKFNFTYDCSIEHSNNGNPVWPYTLNNGVASSANVSGATPSNMGGIWEIAVHNLGGQTGFDYNFYDAGNAGGYGSALKADLDARYNGNRSPLVINAHADYYSEEWPEENPTVNWNSTIEERRSIMAGVIDYALAKEDVRMVPIIDIIRWMRDPVELGATFVDANAFYADKTVKTASINRITSSTIEITLPKTGTYSLALFGVSGRKIMTLASGEFAQGTKTIKYIRNTLHRGLYLIKLTGSDVSAVEKLTVSTHF